MKKILIASAAIIALLGVVPSPDSRSDQTGDGSTTTFFFGFKTTDVTHLSVSVDGTPTTAYSAYLNPDSMGGAVTFYAPPADKAKVRIERTLPLTQDSVWAPYAAFKMKNVEGQLDARVMQMQQIDRKVADTAGGLAAETARATAADAAEASARAAGDAASQGYASSLVTGVLAGTGAVPQEWSATADGVATRYAVPGAELGTGSMYLVTVGGVPQIAVADYSIDLAAHEVAFSVTPPAGADVRVRAFGYARGVQESDTTLVRSTGSTTSRTLAARFADVVNVKDYGAKGDGTTDDTAARVLTFAAGAGREILLPAGTYLVDPFTLSGFSNTIIRGAGKNATIIKSRSGSGTFLSITKSRYITFSDLTIDGGGGGTAVALTSDNAPTVIGHIFRNVRIQNAALGLQLADSSQYAVSEILFDSVEFKNCVESVNQAGDNTTDIWWTKADFSVSLAQASEKAAYRIKGGGSVNFVEVIWSPMDVGTNGSAIYLDGDAGTNEAGTAVPPLVTIEGGRSELPGFFIDTNPAVAGPFAASAARTTIRVSGSEVFKTNAATSVRLRGTYPATLVTDGVVVATPAAVWLSMDDGGASHFIVEKSTTLLNGATTIALGSAGYIGIGSAGLGSSTSYFDANGKLLLRGGPTVATDSTNTQITIQGNKAAADGGSDVVLDTVATRSAGFIASFRNHGTDQMNVDRAGRIVWRQPGNSTGSPGNATINAAAGRSAIAAGASTLVITNSLVSASSIVFAVLQTADATATSIKTVVPGAGSFTITVNANATAATNVGWVVFN